LQIEEGERHFAGSDLLNGLSAVCRRHDGVPEGGEHLPEEGADAVIRIDEENLGLHVGGHFRDFLHLLLKDSPDCLSPL
jgi:hypothetical protein